MDFFEQLEEKQQEKKKFEKIIEEIRKIPEGEMDFETSKQLVNALNNIEAYDEAISVLKSIEEQGKKDKDWHYFMGYAYCHRPYIVNGAYCLNKEQDEAALFHFLKAKELGYTNNVEQHMELCYRRLDYVKQKEEEEKKKAEKRKNSKQAKQSKNSKQLWKKWKKRLDEDCADEVEELILDYVKAGFLSDEEIAEECEMYIEEEYPEDAEEIETDILEQIIGAFRKEWEGKLNAEVSFGQTESSLESANDVSSNIKPQQNYQKLAAAFLGMEARGVVTAHYAGFADYDGFDKVNEEAAKRHENGETVIGCCFYTQQDLEHVFNGHPTKLYFCFGSYFDHPTIEEVGKVIVEELEKVGFTTEWNGSGDEKIAITNLHWDKTYIGENK
uniref:DUF6891 domain-containing protein n=1 Tax=Agathobacter sp. TaxID=2021311 RepID=UPI004056FABF